MLSEDTRKNRGIPGKYWFFVVAAIVIICQLIALMLLADSQVAKARVRDELLSAQRLAIAQCIETNIGTKRHNCIREVSVASASVPAQQRQSGKGTQLVKVSGTVTASAIEVGTPAAPVIQAGGVLPAVLSVR